MQPSELGIGQGVQPMMDLLRDNLAGARAKFNKLATAQETLARVKKELLGLADLGDMISPDDVVKAAGALVAHGLRPEAMAGLLAEMPQNGPGIAQWVGQHLQMVAQREAQLAPVLAGAQHQMGVAALQALTGHHIESLAQGAMPPGNPLSPAPAAGPQPGDETPMAGASGPGPNALGA